MNHQLTANAISDYYQQAQQILPSAVWAYLQETQGSGRVAEADRSYFDQLTIMPRPLRDLTQGHTKCCLFGQNFQHPILLAPIAYQRLFHAQGEIASALAAVAQDSTMLVSSLASQTLEEIIDAAQQALWFQLYWQGNRENTLKLLKRALIAGYSCVVFTVDAAIKPANFQLPVDIKAVNMIEHSPPNQNVFSGWMQQAPTWQDVAWLRDQCPVPLIIKGLLHADDAKRAEQLACDGIVVSNHGGRILASMPSSIASLADIVAAVSLPVLYDSGIRSGQDIYKALALGARAVLIGRPYIWGLASNGALGVAHVIRLLRDELALSMAIAGKSALSEIVYES